LFEYVRHVVENPYRDGDNVLWNFASHDLREDKLDLEGKDEDRFIVPFQVTSTWGMMFTLLPEEIRNAENLIWRDDLDEYHAYNQLYREVSDERRREMKRHLAKEVSVGMRPV